MSGPQVGGLRPEYTLWQKQVVTNVLTRKHRVSNDLLDVKVKIKNWSRDDAILAKFDHIWDFLEDVIFWLGSSHARSCSKISICVRSTWILQWNQGGYYTLVWDQICTLILILHTWVISTLLNTVHWNQLRYSTLGWDQLWYCTLGILLNICAVHLI